MVAFTNRLVFGARNVMNKIMREENGDVNTTSMVILIGLALVLVVLFREQIMTIIENALEKTSEKADQAIA